MGWGGKRPGAGRKPTGKVYVPHRKRAFPGRDKPIHAIFRLDRGTPDLRRHTSMVADAANAGSKTGFRVTHWAIEPNKVHLIVEATSRASLARGMQGMGIRIARGVNRIGTHDGKVFADRYEARELAPKDMKEMSFKPTKPAE